MWFKRNHTGIFYAGALPRADTGRDTSSSNAKATTASKAKLDRHEIMLRDAVRHDFKVLPPDLKKSGVNWQRKGRTGLLAGFDQIPGIGEVTAEKIVEFQDTFRTWSDLINVPGIGPVTKDKIVEFVNKEDPFNIYRLEKILTQVKKDLPGLDLPEPTHQAVDVPYERGDDVEVVWIGVGVHRNLRDIFEVNRARSGEELDPSEVKDPDKNEFMLVAGYDGTDLLSLRVTRWKYPRLRKILWDIKLNDDVLLVRGTKPGWRTAREIYVNDLWVLQP
jgi:hypothetical protein